MSSPWYHPAPGFPATGWAAGWTDSTGPDFRAEVTAPAHRAAVGALVREAGLQDAAWAQQVHGDRVLQVTGPGTAGEADALWTDRPELGVIGRSADCPLTLLGGRRADGSLLWGFAHASWRSTMAGISAKLALALLAAGAAPDSLTATICPSAGPCCYEVGPEVRTAALDALGDRAAGYFRPHADRWILDLWAANREQLEQEGVPAGAIRTAGICTICGGAKYPSYRREGRRAGRFAAIIGGRIRTG